MTALTDGEYLRIIAVLEGTGRTEDDAWVEIWKDQHPANASLFAHLGRTKLALKRAGDDQLELRMARLKEAIEAHLDTPIAGSVSGGSAIAPSERVGQSIVQVSRGVFRPQSFPSKGWVYGGAAICGLGLVLMSLRGMNSSKASASHERVYATTTGQRATFTLDDGTQVVLAPRSQLRVDSRAASGAREIVLDGEALFTVAARPSTPFVVRTGAVRTAVLGTTFDVRRYTNDSETRVFVTEGKVAVDVANAHTSPTVKRRVVLTEGMSARASDSTLRATQEDVTALAEWKSGRLIFRRTPVHEALATLERWYGYRFVVSDSSLSRQHLSATFDYGRADDMFSALKTLLDATLTFDGNVVIVSPRGHALPPIPARDAVRDSMTHVQGSNVGR